jgi:aspartyl-tRNA(Asn)/glutamyl-tRNA(Gln) amidotransferase subunit A
MSADLSLSFASATDLSLLLERREISSEDLVRNCLQRLEDTEPLLNAFTHVDELGALKAARTCDQQRRSWRDGQEPLGALHGVPVSVKELIEVAGMPCRYGSRTMSAHVAQDDAPAVARIRRAGAVILGMTNTSEFGFRGFTDNKIHGLTRNPWNLRCTPGGSSGGAASSVAAGVTPMALGTDGGGSIRNPSSFTGLVGIKPQFGRVPIFPVSATSTLAHVGPMTRRAVDARLLLNVMAGPDSRDWNSVIAPMSALSGWRPGEPLRVAFAESMGYGTIDAEIRGVVRAAVEKLGALLTIREVDAPICDDESELFLAEFIGGVHARLGAALDTQPDEIDPLLLRMLRAFEDMPATRYAALLRRRHAHRERIRQFFEGWDVLLTPMTPCAAWPVTERTPAGLEGYRLWTFYGYPFNLTGQPAASVPCGFTSTGLPVGMQVVVNPYREQLLCDVLERFEEVIEVFPRRPDLSQS